MKKILFFWLLLTASPFQSLQLAVAQVPRLSTATQFTPSLNLDFTQSDAVLPGETFTRASTATRFNASGVMETVAANVPRRDFDPTSVVVSGQNLITNSQTVMTGFAGWGGGAVGTINSAQAPDGSMTASTITTREWLFRDLNGNSGTYTFSVWLKAAAGTSYSTNLALWNYQSSVIIVTKPIAVTDTWQRFWVTGTTYGAGMARVLIVGNGATNPNAGTMLWQAQLTEGSTLLPDVYTGATAIQGTKTASVKGRLIEEQRTNVVPWSTEMTNWLKTNATVSSNVALGLDGATTADLVVETTANDQHLISISTQGFASVAGQPYTLSCYVKPAGRSRVLFAVVGTSILFGDIYIDLLTDSRSVPIRDGWYRVTITGTANVSGSFIMYCALLSNTGLKSYTGDGVSGAYFWGAQVELGAYATSYIPTTTATVSRSAELCLLNNTSNWYNPLVGTWFAEAYNTGSRSSYGRIIGTTSNYSIIETTPTPGTIQSWSGTATLIGPAVISANRVKMALSYSPSGRSLTQQGLTPNNIANPFTVFTGIIIGSSNGSSQLNGAISGVRYWPTRLPNSYLQTLTN